MRLKCVLGLLIAAVLLLGGGAPWAVVAQSPAGEQLRLLSSNGQGILLEWTTADFQIERAGRAGETCQRVLIPGTVQTTAPGQPQVPVRGVLLGLPAAEGVSVQVVEAEVEVLHPYRLCPAPTLQVLGDDVGAPLGEVSAPDPARYASDAFYPAQPVAIGMAGYLRDQPVAQVQFYPLQYNPATGQVRLYRRILARVTWEAPSPAATAGARWASPAYERLLQSTLLNYEARERSATTEQPATTEVVTTSLSSFPARAGRIEEGLFSAAVTPTLKIGVTTDGLYQLTYDDLTSARFSLSGVDPRTLVLSQRGVEIPILIAGEDDGRFDPGDVLLFYGAAMADAYTTHNVYWLTAGGSPGRRMETRDGTISGSAPVPTHFPTTLHAEEDTYYWVTMPDGQGQDHWFWENRLTAPGWRDYYLPLHHLSTAASTVTVRVRLKGRTDADTYPDHHTRIYLNGVEIDDQRWDGFQAYEHQVAVPHSYLREGGNVLQVQGVGDTGAAVDQFFLNWIEVAYWDTYVAEEDTLLLGAPSQGTFQFEVTGFGGNEVEVFDVTDPADVVRITNGAVVAHGSGYKLRFEDTARPETRYLALTPARRRTPASLELDRPSNWRSPGNGADDILITHGDLLSSALRLADHRRAQGLRVVTVEVEDLYDEFNAGIFNPQAIRDFLAYAYDHWTAPAPTYVTLLGSTTYDYRNLLDLERASYVPTQMIETAALGQTPSDNWFVLLSGADVLPDMLIGRLTAQSPAEAEDVVDKVIYYEAHPPPAPWNTQVLLVADDDEWTFESISEDLASRLPSSYTANRIYAADYPPGDPRDDVINHINGGSVLVHYSGHGNVDRWGAWSGGRILNRSDVAALHNVGRLPVVSIATCLNGYFVSGNVSMAEEFLLQDDRGAAAVWADSGLGYPSGHRVLMAALYDAIFQDDLYTLGAATTAAKIAAYAQSGYGSEMVETYVLFGDPAMRLGLPPIQAVSVEGVTVSGPDTGAIGTSYAFSAATRPITATLPVTYTWQATGQAPLTRVGGLSDVVTFTWHTSGTQALTVTAMNAGGAVAATHVVTTYDVPPNPQPHIYLPLVIKGD